MTHLLVTNDFPPKIGGIQSYLWELWRRLPPGRFEVLTTSHPGASAFDAQQDFPVHRLPEAQTRPSPRLTAIIRERAKAMGAELVVLDPAVPLGLVGPRLGMPYALVLHGAEVTVPGRLPVSRQLLGHVLRHAVHVIAAGTYPAAEGAHAAGAGRLPPVTVIPPGVDTDRFRPLDRDERAAVRLRWGIPPDARLVLSVSRLVPRKGMDVLIKASARLVTRFPDLVVAIAGQGRDTARLQTIIGRTGAPARLLGPVDDADLPGLYGCAEVFAMLCRSRWGGLEQEGFGIVFLEAAAAGVPQVAGRSGGAHEAVDDGVTGWIVDRPASVEAVEAAVARALTAGVDGEAMGRKGRERAESSFSYDVLGPRLEMALAGVGG